MPSPNRAGAGLGRGPGDSVAAQLATCGPGAAVLRHAGADRFETSVRIAEALFPYPSPGGVNISNGLSWADAVVAAGLSRSYSAPVLLSDGAGLVPSVQSYLSNRMTSSLEGWVTGSVTGVSKSAEGTMEALYP